MVLSLSSRKSKTFTCLFWWQPSANSIHPIYTTPSQYPHEDITLIFFMCIHVDLCNKQQLKLIGLFTAQVPMSCMRDGRLSLNPNNLDRFLRLRTKNRMEKKIVVLRASQRDKKKPYQGRLLDHWL